MTSSEKKHLLYLVLFSFALRLFVFIATPVIGGDSYNFVAVARYFSEGKFYEGLKEPIHPFFPWIIYLFSLITGEYEVSGKATSLLFGTLTTLPVYFLARSLFTHKVALFAVLLLAINPAHVRHSADIMSESTYIFFFVTSIWLAWEASVQRKAYIFLLTGFSILAAYLTRAEGIVLLFVILPWLSFAYLRDKRHILSKGLLHLSLIAAIFIVGSMPYLYFIDRQKVFSTKELESLPPNVEFPRFLESKISYDNNLKILVFYGIMSPKERDALLILSSDNTYKNAVEGLFQKSRKWQWLFTRQQAALQFVGARHALVEATNSETAVTPTDNFKAVKARTQLKGSKPDSIRLAEWKGKGHYHMIGLYILNTYAKVYYLPLLPLLFLGLFKFALTRITYKEVVEQPSKALILFKGLRLRRASKDPRAEYLLLGLFVIYFIIFFKFAYTSYYLSGRYVLPLVVMGCLWGGVGLQVVSEYLSKAFPSLQDASFGLSRATIVMVVVSLILALPKDLKVKRSHEVVQKVAGRWIKEHCPEKPPIIMGLEKVAFYANGEFVGISRLDMEHYEKLIASALSRGVEYLVFYKELFDMTNPDLSHEINSGKDFLLLKEWTVAGKEGDRHLKLYRNREIVQKIAGRWIKEREGFYKKRPVVVGLEKVAFYADGIFVDISELDLTCYENLMKSVRNHDVDYLALYEEQMERINPDLLREINSGKDFTFLKEWTAEEGNRHLRLYRCRSKEDGK